jgi:LPPG:FO 2-phospho-L-lactate transferase
MPRVVALSGGVGGARLVDGLAAVVPAEDLTVVVNTGDDFVHWGLTICPDLDTVMYTLSGLAHPEQGWGIAGETFGAFAMMERHGQPAWFRLGDRDLATHLVRTQALAAGRSLTKVTDELCRGPASAARSCRCPTRRGRP